MALSATALGQLSAAQAAASTADSGELSEGQKALAEVQESVRRVEVTGQRSERTTVFANPDGYTFTNKVRLYVNVVFQSEVDAGVPWSATGGLPIGRAKWSGNYVDYFDGVVDEVTVWQRTFTSEEVANDAKLLVSEQSAGVELIADWNPTRGVDGTKDGDAKPYTAQIGSGEFVLGRADASGGWKHFLPARISEVRLWGGAMASAEQVEATMGD